MVLSGGSLPPRASRSTKLNSDPDRSSSPRIRPPPPKRKTTESHHDSAGQRLFQRPARDVDGGEKLMRTSRDAIDPMSPVAPIVWRNLISLRKASRRSLPRYVKAIAVFRTEVAESSRPRTSPASRAYFL